MWFLEYVVYAGFERLNKYFRVKFIKYFMKDNEAQHKSRLEVNMTPITQGPKHEAIKLQGLEQKMQELVRQVPLSKPRRK
jgi:hypothetical protein